MLDLTTELQRMEESLQKIRKKIKFRGFPSEAERGKMASKYLKNFHNNAEDYASDEMKKK